MRAWALELLPRPLIISFPHLGLKQILPVLHVWPWRDMWLSSPGQKGKDSYADLSPLSRSLPLQMTRMGGESLGHLPPIEAPPRFFLENSFWWDPKPLPWHGADLFPPMERYLPGILMVACKWGSQQWLAGVIHFTRAVPAGELVGRGCFSACTVSQPTLARPEPGLNAAWANGFLV